MPGEECGDVRQVGSGFRALGREDLAIPEQEGPRHLKAITSEMADSATFENGDGTQPPDARPEEFQETTPAEAEGAVELATGICDAGDVPVTAKIADFRAALEHVHQHQFTTALLGGMFELLKPSQKLARKGAAEMTQENQHQQTGFGCRTQGFAVRKTHFVEDRAWR